MARRSARRARSTRKLLEAGARIWEFQPCKLHTKLIVLDDTVYLGSANFDMRSLFLNLEIVLKIEDAALAERLREYMEHHLPAAEEITPAIHARPRDAVQPAALAARAGSSSRWPTTPSAAGSTWGCRGRTARRRRVKLNPRRLDFFFWRSQKRRGAEIVAHCCCCWRIGNFVATFKFRLRLCASASAKTFIPLPLAGGVRGGPVLQPRTGPPPTPPASGRGVRLAYDASYS